MKKYTGQLVLFHHSLQDFLIISFTVEMELYRTLSPFLFMKKFDGQMLPFMNPCKIRWNSDLQAIVRRRKRNKTIPVKMKGIVMDARVGNLTVESSLHHFM